MDNIIISTKQIENMKHCIGFDRKKVKRGKYEAYRNYYTTPDNDLYWDGLMDMGLAHKRYYSDGVGDNPQCYWLSDKGFEFISRLLEVKISKIY